MSSRYVVPGLIVEVVSIAATYQSLPKIAVAITDEMLHLDALKTNFLLKVQNRFTPQQKRDMKTMG